MPRFAQAGSQAAQASFPTVEHFLTTETDLSALLETNAVLQEAYDAVRLHFAPPVVDGATLLDQIKTSTNILSSGCDSIDALLEGGFWQGHLTEIYGESGSGKTQLCMMASARAAARGAHVVYIDTSNAFSASRLCQMIKSMPNATVTVQHAVECVSVIRAYTAHAALAALDNLLRQESSMEIVSQRPSVIVLDSIGAVMAAEVGSGGVGTHMQGHAMLAAAAMLLKQVAQKLQVAVIVTNHMVGGGGKGGWNSNRGNDQIGRSRGAVPESEKRPALGESWHSQSHCRVQLSLPQNEGGPWTAVIRASTLEKPGKAVAEYWLTAAGVASTASVPRLPAGQQPGGSAAGAGHAADASRNPQ